MCVIGHLLRLGVVVVVVPPSTSSKDISGIGPKRKTMYHVRHNKMKREAPGSSISESEATPQKKQKQDNNMSEEKMDVTATADGK